MNAAFLNVFRGLHPDHQCDIQLQFRLRLLKFVVLFERRSSRLHLYPLEPRCQGAQKDQNVTESRSGHKSKGPIAPLSQSELHASLSLLDTLPHFMALSAAQLMLQGSHITDVWMKLAAAYMTHAVMEHHFAHGEHDISVVQRAFAWGFDEQSISEERSDECQINAMFFDEDLDKQVEGWEKTRDDHINAVRESDISSFLSLIGYLIISSTRRMVPLCYPIYKHLLSMNFRQWILSNAYLSFWITYVRVNRSLCSSRLVLVSLKA